MTDEPEIEAGEGPSDAELSSVRKLAAEQAMLIAEVERLERELAIAQDKLKVNQTKDLLDAMVNAGMRDFTLQDGRGVVIEEGVHAGPSAENKPLALDWLRANGHEAIIKTNLAVHFEKGQQGLLKKLLSIVNGFKQFKGKLRVEASDKVEYQTMGATVRRQLAEESRLRKLPTEKLSQADLQFLANPLPEKIFGVHRTRAAVVVAPDDAKPKKKAKKNGRPDEL